MASDFEERKIRDQKKGKVEMKMMRHNPDGIGFRRKENKRSKEREVEMKMMRYKDLLEVSCAASKSGNYSERSTGDKLIIGFCGSLSASAFNQMTTKFGECEISENNRYFSSLVHWSPANGKTQQALVHREALNKFVDIWSNSELETKVVEALEAKKTVLFSGHSIGGAIATLATLLILEKKGKEAPVFAITFGFPLIGDEVFAGAVRRQGWANHFFNVVSRGDVFARILLAPCESVSKPLEALLPYWQKSAEQMNEAPPAALDFPEHLRTVLRHACAVVNFMTVNNMEPTNKLIAGLKPAIKLSPYRPFGYYLFCSDKGNLCVENYEAVLPILFYSLATCKDQANISDHTDYGRAFSGNTSIVNLEGLQNLPLSQGAALSSDMEIQLNALGLGIQARLALRAAGEHENKLSQNFTEVLEELNKLDRTEMTKLKNYRNKSLNQKNMPYYEAFKAHREEPDFHANLNRLKLAALYDRIENLVETHELPDDFQCNEELIRKGTEYRLYVEPLDIANYYRLGKHEDSGHYMKNARPRRYKALQKWLADKNIEDNSNQPEITKDSCFWAYVEEISCLMNDPKEKQENVKTQCENFQKNVKGMIERNELCVEEVMMGQSSFKELLKKLKQESGGGASPLSSLFNRIG